MDFLEGFRFGASQEAAEKATATAAAVRTALVQARIDGDDGTEEEGARHQRWR